MRKFKRFESGEDGGAVATAVAAVVPAHKDLFMHSRALPPPPLTDAVLNEAQAALGVVLPAAYVEVGTSSHHVLLVTGKKKVLRSQNGGFLEKCAFPSAANSWAPNHVPVEYLPGIWVGPSADSELPELRELQKKKQAAGIPAELVLLAGDERHFVALDYSGGKSGEPRIVFWQRGQPTMLPLADDFGAFLAGLCDEESLPAVVAPPAGEAAFQEVEEEEERVAPGWGMAALLGPDLDEDDEDDGSFEGAQGGDEEQDEEIVDDGDLDLEGEVQGLAEEEGEHETLPPGRKRARPEDPNQ